MAIPRKGLLLVMVLVVAAYASPSDPIDKWSIEDVSWLLQDEGLSEHVPLFVRERINGPLLLRTTDADLLAVGMTNPLHRKRLLARVEAILLRDAQQAQQAQRVEAEEGILTTIVLLPFRLIWFLIKAPFRLLWWLLVASLYLVVCVGHPLLAGRFTLPEETYQKMLKDQAQALKNAEKAVPWNASRRERMNFLFGTCIATAFLWPLTVIQACLRNGAGPALGLLAPPILYVMVPDLAPVLWLLWLVAGALGAAWALQVFGMVSLILSGNPKAEAIKETITVENQRNARALTASNNKCAVM